MPISALLLKIYHFLADFQAQSQNLKARFWSWNLEKNCKKFIKKAASVFKGHNVLIDNWNKHG